VIALPRASNTQSDEAPASKAGAARKSAAKRAASKAKAAAKQAPGKATKSAGKRSTAVAKRAAGAAKKAVAKKTTARKAGPKRTAKGLAGVRVAKSAAQSASTTEEGLEKFLKEQRNALEAERATYEAQAEALKAEADQMALDAEPGDIQFDDESGEGGTVNVDRERDLALSAQARAAVEEIEHALAKIASGAYGACERCGQSIPKARLRALPQARLCVACKSGGLSRR
jgi:DnaK suppressor protein